jgi:dolichyl-phosphate-mannose--protein O-mannosyl transferase
VARPRAPLVALALIVAVSAGLRMYDLDAPCSQPCTRTSDHTLIFDESYYVNAARVIDHIRPPAHAPYSDAPFGKDPNAEHPQLAKLVIAGGIDLFGDGAWGWRIGSIVFGLIAIAAMYSLARAAGGSPWLAVGAAAVMAADNLALVHGRIATLDIYALAPMLVAAALYLRRRFLLAGVVLGIAASMKLVALYLVPALFLIEAISFAVARPRRGAWVRPALARLRPFATATGAAVVALVLIVWLLDALVPAFDPGSHTVYGGSPFRHLDHMLSYAANLKSIPHATGISSSPWQWLVDQKPIEYARTAVNVTSQGKIVASHAVVSFRGEVNPFLMFVAIPALFAAAAAAWRERDRLALVGVAWCLGTFIPFVIQADVFHRITYLYYVLVALPGVYLVAVRLFSPARVPAVATVGWAVALIYGLVDLYPIRG